MIREVGESIGRAVLDGVGRASSSVQERKPLPVDLLESDDTYLVVFDAPGTSSENVRVDFENGTVKVQIDRFRDPYEEFELRYPGRGLSLHGSIDLPKDANVDVSNAEATVTPNGTLEIRLPKDEEEEEEEEEDEDEES